jgi:hypothetical protein
MNYRNKSIIVIIQKRKYTKMESSLSVQEHYSHQPQSFYIPPCRKSLPVLECSFKFLYAGKGFFSGTGRLFQHRGMEKVPFQGPEVFPAWAREEQATARISCCKI